MKFDLLLQMSWLVFGITVLSKKAPCSGLLTVISSSGNVISGPETFSEVTRPVSCFNVAENDALYEIAQFWADDPTGLLHPANERHPTLEPLNHGLVMKCGPEKGDPYEADKRYKTLIIAPSHLC